MSNADKPRPVEGIVGPKIGDKVRATMNGIEWFRGTFVEKNETFAQYGVEVDGEIRFFLHAETQLEQHPCDIGNGEFDHDWYYQSDWYGDPEVVGGTADCSFWRCRDCGVEDHDRQPPDGAPYCQYCGAMTRQACNCGPIADNN